MSNITVNVAKWKKEIELQTKLVINHGQKIVERSAELLKERIQSYTPVDTGYLRGNWTLSVDGNQITISNDAVYALRIEQGWSRQAPEGMMRRGIMDWPLLLKQAQSDVGKL